jgi:23S rRNA pseudouridine955/2504/2580 synthase
MEIRDIIVGEKIYKFLSRRYTAAFGVLQKFLREKSIRVNGKKTSENYVLLDGDIVNINNFAMKILDGVKKEPKVLDNVKPSIEIIDKVKKSIIFEDDKVLVINKPYGLSVQGGSGIKVSLDDVLPHLSLSLKLVHRLDRDTTGVLIIAKNNRVAETLAKKFKERDEIKKTYLVVVHGKLKNSFGVINLPLLKKYENNVEKVYVDNIAGKEAVTEYRTVAYNEDWDISLLRVNILTGRTHQIRVHMKEIGNSVIGDFKYGRIKDKKISDRMLLHSYRMEVELGGKGYEFTSPPPEEFGKFFNMERITE